MKKITLLLFAFIFSINGFSQISEGFEGTAGPDALPSTNWTLTSGNWAHFDNGVSATPNVDWSINPTSYAGTIAAYMNRQNVGNGNTSEDYLATPLVTIPTNGQLRFFSRTFTAGLTGTLYQIKIAPSTASQTDPIAYSLVQQYNEDQLTFNDQTSVQNPFNTYTEKVIDLSAFAGTQVYIAFVMRNTQAGTGATGDRWLLDNVNIAAQCFTPTGLATAGIFSGSANLTWANPSGSTSWEIEVLPAASAPTGVGIIYNGALPYLATTTATGTLLTPNTDYIYYVRSICDGGLTSTWAGPFAFTTTTLPPVCGGNFVDPGGPTANYPNNVTAATGTTTICPIVGTDKVTVTFTSFNTQAGSDTLTIYDGNSTASPVLGVYSGTALPPAFTASSVNGCLTFVFISNGTTNAAGWIANVTCAPPPNCPSPNALVATVVTSTTIPLSWTNIGPATSWEVLALPCGSPTPTITTSGTPTSTNPFTITGLTPNTCYDVYVRGNCTSEYSNWSIPITVTTPVAPPECGGNFVDSGGTGGAYSNGENITTTICPTIAGEKVTVTFTAFNTEATWDGLYVYNGNTVTPAALLPSANGAGNVPGGLAGSYWGTAIPGPFTSTTADGCLTFVFRSDTSVTNPGWVSNITCAPPPTCQQPTTLTVTSITTTSAQLGWVSPGTATSWQVIAVAAGSPPPNATTTGWTAAPTNPFVLTGLTPGFAYEYYVRGDCGPVDGVSLWSGPRAFATIPTCLQPTTLTVTAVTSTSAQLNWTSIAPSVSWQVLALPCGSPAPTATTTGWVAAPTNPFVLTGLNPTTCYLFYVRGVCTPTDISFWSASATATTQVTPPLCGGTFTDPGGPTANYANNLNSVVTICPTNPGEIVTVTFTAFNTEATWDGLYVYDGNTVTPAALLPSANPAGNVPGGLAGSYWGTAIPGPFTSTTADGCLTFVFRSDASVNNPGWVSNVTCSPAPTCARPTALTATAITQTSATLSWTQPLNPNGSQANAWEVLILPAGSPIPTTAGIPATSPYLATGLTPGTAYVFYVRAICSSTDASVWGALPFATIPINDECANATFAIVNQNLNCVQTTPGTLAGATGSNPVTTCPGVANDDVWFTFTATAVTHVISFNNVSLPAPALNYAIFQGTDCGTLTQVGCNTGANLVPGTTYFIRVYSASAIPQFTTFNLCIGTLPCTEAPAFCTGQTVTYANATNVPSLGQIGCLFTSPNPAFFFLQVNQAGPLSYLISQVDTGGVPRDVDYVAWGPFANLEVACSGVPANPLPGAVPIPTPTTGCPGTLHACSYSTAAQEIMCIPNAQLCEVYVIMITNFSNQAGTVTFTQTNTGGGTTECFPINTFNYPQTYYCQDGVDPTPVLAPGAANGTYTSTPGLVIDPVTGIIDLSASTPGPYIVTSTTLTSTGGVCTNIPTITTTRTIIITAPANASIAYSAPSYCNTITTTQDVTLTGTTGGTFSATPAGLLLNVNTGGILPVASLPGVYTVTYTIPAFGGCPAFSNTTQVEIINAPTPTFTQVAPICPNDVLADLPTTSLNGITGTWSPAMNNTATTTYTFTPVTGVCARIATMTIQVGTTTPVFTQVAPICPNATLADLPTTSNNGVVGTWSPAMNNTATTTYTFTPNPGICSSAVTMTIVVLEPTIVPTFTTVLPICINGVLTPLPTTSNNGITGSWSPALDNTATTTYTFTPNTGQCALTTTLTIIVNPQLNVTVNSPNFCPGSSATVTATPEIPGNYSYTWTVPTGATDPGNVASFSTSVAGTYSVVINQVTNFCNTDFESPTATGAFPNLFNENLVPCWDTTSADGIIEIWPPGFEGVFAYSGNQLIELNGNTPGTLFQDFSVLPGTALTISFAHRGRQGNDVVGVEIGPLGGPYVSLGNFTDNTAWALHTVNYIIPLSGGNDYTLRFVSVSSAGGSPSIGNLLDAISISSLSCPSQSASGTVSLITPVAPTFDAIPDICLNGPAPLLPSSSLEGISGTWTPSTIDTSVLGTVTYNFTSTSGTCPTTATLNVTIINQVLPLFNGIAAICQNSPAPSLPLTSLNGITGTWNPSTIDTSVAGTVTYTFTPDATPSQACAIPTTLTITIDPQIVTTFNAIANICQNGVAPLLATSSNEGFTGTWNPSIIDTSVSGTVTYTFTPDSGICATTATLNVTIDAPTLPAFIQIPSICLNGTAPTLPASSINGGITGTWSPATIDTTTAGTVVYTFTPDAPFCASQATMSITIDAPTLATFAQIAAICQGGVAPSLPATSGNGIAGTWSPATISTATAGTTTYTFTPNVGLCATGTTMTITIHPTPVVAPIANVSACDSYTLPTLTTGNYFAATGGINPITNLTITATQTVFVYAQSGTTPNCTDEESFTVTISSSPQFTIDGGCDGGVYVLEVIPTDFTVESATFNWTDSNNLTVGNASTLLVTTSGNYSCTVTVNGCPTTEVFAANEITCLIPKGISPNGDGLNDTFDLSGYNVKELNIFNRYGTKVYSKREYTNQWEGQSDKGENLPDGTYYFVIDRNDAPTKTGWVYINRENK